jgi:ABC-type multidrug transport system fused ATPase/permease subunit
MKIAGEKKKMRVTPVLRRYFAAAIQYPWLLVLIFSGGAVIELSSVTSALVIRRLVDILSTSTPSAAAASILFMTLAVFGIVSFGGWVGQRMRQLGLTYIEPKVMNDLTRTAFAYLLGHSHDFFISNFSGALTRRVTRYGRSFESVLDNISFNFFATALYATGILIILWSRSAILGGIVLGWTIIFIYIQIAMARWRQPLRVARAEEDSNVTGVLSDAIGNYSAINLFASAKQEQGIFNEESLRFVHGSRITGSGLCKGSSLWQWKSDLSVPVSYSGSTACLPWEILCLYSFISLVSLIVSGTLVTRCVSCMTPSQMHMKWWTSWNSLMLFRIDQERRNLLYL